MGAAAQGVDYATQIKPILSTRCYSCHSALRQQSGLRLDTAAMLIQGGDSGAAASGNSGGTGGISGAPAAGGTVGEAGADDGGPAGAGGV